KPRSTPKSATLRRTSSSRRSNCPVKRRTIRNDEGGPRAALFVLRCAVRPPGLAPDLLVPEGYLSFGELHLKAGDFHVATPSSSHPSGRTVNGCLVHVIMSLDQH